MTRISTGNETSGVTIPCLNYLKGHSKVAWAARMNTGGMSGEHTDRYGHKKKRFVAFSFPGCSDIIGQLTDGRLLAVECKRPEYAYGEKKDPADRLSDQQRAFIELVEKNNGAAFVTDSLEDLEWFMNKLKIKS